MPEKTQEERTRRAKAQGTPKGVKASELGRAGGLSAHAAKKSRAVVGRDTFEDRAVSARRPPGEGKTRRGEKLPAAEGGSTRLRRKTLPVEAAVAYRKDERRKQPRGEAAPRQEARRQQGSAVRGRKKAPGEMNVKRRGGPKKRQPLHGG